jgi:TIR domain-containing protein
MGYLPNFDEDVFISYATNDDDVFPPEQSGWVTRLHQDLQQRVRNYLGADVRLWRDSEIRNNEDFTKKIMNRLVRTATFMSVLSPSFLQREWCRRELDSFASHAESQSGILVNDEGSRIFKVEKMPVERNALPQTMQGTKTYRFYQPDPAQPKRTIELRPLLGGEYYRRYFEEMDELAKDIAVLLKSMAHTAGTPRADAAMERPIVYLAETTFDLDEKLGEIRRDLKDRGHIVLPDRDLPYRADAYKEKVSDSLRQAAMSVHLIGANYGFVPEGEVKSNVWLQHDLAMARGADPNFRRLIWMPRDLSAADQRQREFATYLTEDAGTQQGADLLNGNIEELKTVIHEMLIDVRKRNEGRRQKPLASEPAAAAPARAADDPICVYVMCEPADRKSPQFVALRKYLLSQNCEPVLPATDDRGTALQIHIENLSLCDACLIYYGEGAAEWMEQKLRDLRKHVRGRQPPMLAKAIYIASPPTDHKADLETLEALVLRDGEALSAAALDPFMQRIHAATTRT